MEKVGRELSHGGPARRAAAAIALAALIALTFAASPAVAKKVKAHKHEPDLVVTAAGLEGEPYAFRYEKGEITVEDVTKNTGSGRAGPSLTRVYLLHGGKQLLLTERAVPALGPGKEDRDEGSSQIFAPHVYPIGEYTLRICADARNHVDESDELNNCKRMLPRHFFIAARAWTGSLGGTETQSTLTDRWQSTNAELLFDQYDGGGVFNYLFTGAVTWTISGTDSEGCTITGTGTKTYDNDASIGALRVDYLNANYTGNLNEIGGPFFQVTFSNCPHPPTPGPALYEPDFWQPTPASPVPLPFGSSVLPGSPAQLFGATWTWNLRSGHREQ